LTEQKDVWSTTEINPVLPIAGQNFLRYLEKHLEFFMFFSLNPVWETLLNKAYAGAYLAEIAAVTLGHIRFQLRIGQCVRYSYARWWPSKNTTAEIPLSSATVCLHCLLCVDR
jgi:hypothetical protein